jgi:predicted dithiol-disulfide oxidoreductase (DUF899 family)
MLYTRLAGETEEYRKLRDELRLAEIDLIAQRERVAELRRALPPGPVVDDYLFLDCTADDTAEPVRLSELFSGPNRPLVVYHLMYGKQQTSPCPMCTMWIDGFNGVAHHLAQNVDLAIAAAAEPAALQAHARDRGWDRLRLLSCGESSFKYDLGSEDEHGGQNSSISVFTLDAEGSVRHTYSARPQRSEDLDQRGLDALCAVWNILDLTPQGRDEWYASLSYEDG